MSDANRAGNGGGKICIHCRQDCSGKPRTKDLQGNYSCKECLERLKRKSASRPTQAVGAGSGVREDHSVFDVAPDDDAAVLASLLEGEAVSHEPCPACGVFFPPNGQICLSCGYNKATGKQVRTVAVSAPREKRQRKSREPSAALDLLTSPMMLFFGLLVLYIGTFFLAMDNEPMMILFLLTVVIGGITAWVYEIIAAFADDDSGWGICAICQIVPCIGGICSLAMLYYVFAVSDRGRLKAVVGANIIGGVMFAVFSIQNPNFASFGG